MGYRTLVPTKFTSRCFLEMERHELPADKARTTELVLVVCAAVSVV